MLYCCLFIICGTIVESKGQLTLPILSEDKKSFENFFGEGNSELIKALNESVSDSSHRVIYYYGPPGSGKTHLALSVTKIVQGHSVIYLSLNDERVVPEMLSIIDVSGVVILDDIQAWAGDGVGERALFTLFEQVKHANGTLLLSSFHPPEKCGFGLRDLISRLGSGLLYPIAELTENQRFTALKMRATNRGLLVSDEALTYLVTRMRRDNHELFSFLDKLDRASLKEKRKVTIPFLKELINQ